MEDILKSIKNTMKEEGYVVTIQSRELRRYEWEKGLKIVSLSMNYPMTEMRITIKDPSTI